MQSSRTKENHSTSARFISGEIRGDDSAHTYTMFELNLAPGGGVDLHKSSVPRNTFWRATRDHQVARRFALNNRSVWQCRQRDVDSSRQPSGK